MPLQIVHYNDPVLRRKGEKITVFDTALQRFASDMIECMHSAEGIGLAAQQVGRAVQICVIDLLSSDAEYTWKWDGKKTPVELFMPMVIVNPKVQVAPGTAEATVEEGCLSFPKIRGDVIRPEEVTVRYQDEYGNHHELFCDGLLARCVQHEVDHLNGVLFIDRMAKKSRAEINDAVKDLAKQTRDEKKVSP